MNLKSIPKVELHLHLDGSVDISLASKITGLPIEELKSKMIAKDKCVDLTDYLTMFNFPISIMNSKENIKGISSILAKKLYEENVIYAEVRFAPMLLVNDNLTLDDIVSSAIEGFNEVPIKINIILCMMRGASFDDNLQVIKLAKKYINKGVCAIDLAGAESLYPTIDYKELFAIASKENINYTIHAGESEGYDSLKAAIDFDTKRIGHGIRCIESIELMNLIKEKDIALEVCITSNYQTNAIDSLINHPIKKLKDNGIKVTINTDNRTVSNVSLIDEYQKLIDILGFSINDIIEMNMNAIECAFISENEKIILKENYKKILEKNLKN